MSEYTKPREYTTSQSEKAFSRCMVKYNNYKTEFVNRSHWDFEVTFDGIKRRLELKDSLRSLCEFKGNLAIEVCQLSQKTSLPMPKRPCGICDAKADYFIYYTTNCDDKSHFWYFESAAMQERLLYSKKLKLRKCYDPVEQEFRTLSAIFNITDLIHEGLLKPLNHPLLLFKDEIGKTIRFSEPQMTQLLSHFS